MAYPTNNIGDIPVSKQTVVTALVAPLVLLADLSDPTNVINQRHLSGKQAGAVVLAVLTGTVAAPLTVGFRAALGPLPGDAWVAA